jgi:hypothetical protein
LQDSFKIIIISAFLGVLVFMLTGDKSNEVLLFSFFPLAILGTNFIEYARKKRTKTLTTFLSLGDNHKHPND